MIIKEFGEEPETLELFIYLIHYKSLYECKYFVISYNLFIDLYNYITLKVDLENIDRWYFHETFVLIIDRKSKNTFVGYTEDEFISFERRIKLDKIVGNI